MSALTSSQPEVLLNTHRAWFSCLCLAIGVLYHQVVTANASNFMLELQICIAMVAVFGVAHGSLDFMVMIKDPGAPKCNKRMVAFLTLYSAIALLFLALWLVAPTFALISFLILSVLHFAGFESLLSHPVRFCRQFTLRQSVALAIAGMPVLLPCGLLSSEVEPIIAGLSSNAQSVKLICLVMQGFGLAWTGFAIVTVYNILIQSKKSLSQRDLSDTILLACLAFLALKVSPIVAFTVYFCGMHALEETLKLSMELTHKDLVSGLIEFGKLAWLPTIIVLILAAAYFVYAINNVQMLSDVCSRVLFITLSCITAPHFAVKSIFDTKASPA